MPDKPIHSIRIGHVIASIWLNQTDAGPKHNVQIQKMYLPKGEKTWKYTSSFSRSDLPLVGLVAQQATLWIYEAYQKDDEVPQTEGEES